MSSTLEARLLDDLNPPQREAVLHGEGPLLILAGAGSGKTRVITRRIAHLILSGRVDPMEILAITFTNKAAREMKDRVLRFVPRTDLWISTFHSMAARILRREAQAVGYGNDFTIYDTYDRGQCLRGVLKELDLDEEVHKPGPLGHRISDRKNRGLAPGEADVETGHVDPILARIEKAYAAKLLQSQAMDFDDLLLKLLEVLETKPELARKYSERFRFVLVDEYQDTNHLQYRITAALAGKHRNLCVCGDPDQSIYGWRGADLRNILDFEREFAPVTVVRLETNYRSKRNILDAAQAVIERNQKRKAKRLLTESEAGEKLVWIEADDELDEARTLAGWIRTLTSGGSGSHHFRDIAVFYRANFLQRAVERGLRDAGIPYRVAAGLEFFERREIKDLLAYLRLLVNGRDDVSFGRIVNVPARSIGDTTLEKLRAEAARLGVPLLEAASRREVRAAIGGRAKNAIEGFLQIMDRLRPLADGPAERALTEIIQATRYEDHCGTLGETADIERVENVHELVVSAAEYDARDPDGGARGFLAEVSLVSDTDRLEGEADHVTLMTLHSAKGLEFPVVFIVGAEDGLLPHRRSVQERAGDDGLEEERRLFYVGLTRARERVFLSRARYRMQFGAALGSFVGETIPSRFVLEIPGSLLEGRESLAERDEGPEAEGFDVQVAPRGAHGRYAAGDFVRHAHFGVGKIVELRGTGPNARAVVFFRDIGEKQLLLQYAQLEKVTG